MTENAPGARAAVQRRRIVAVVGILAVLVALLACCLLWPTLAPIVLGRVPGRGSAADAVQIRQLMFEEVMGAALRERHFRALMVVTPTRQAFRVARVNIVSVKPGEADEYGTSHAHGLVRLDLVKLEFAPDGRHATMSYELYEGVFFASGATFAFVKREGKWYKGELVDVWIS